MNELTMLIIGMGVSGGLFALGMILYPKLANEQSGFPLEADVEAALLPFLFKAINLAEKQSVRSFEEFEVRMHGVDKAKLANDVYDMLPDKIGNHSISLVKTIVPRERFAQLVKDAYERMDNFAIQHEKRFEKAYEEWAAQNKPASNP